MVENAAAGPAGWRWRGILTLLACATLLDLLVTVDGGSPSWWAALALFAAVTALAMQALHTGGTVRPATGGCAAALSLAGTVALGLAATVTHRAAGFGFVEVTALTLFARRLLALRHGTA